MKKYLFFLTAAFLLATAVNAQNLPNQHNQYQKSYEESDELSIRKQRMEEERARLRAEFLQYAVTGRSLTSKFTTATSPNLRTANNDPEDLLLRSVRQTYVVETEQFVDVEATHYVYESDNAWHKYTMRVDDAGDFTDTISYEYERYQPDNGKLIYLEIYDKINGEMKLIHKRSGFVETVGEDECGGQIDESYWKLQANTIYSEIPGEEDVMYLSYQSFTEVAGDTTTWQSYDFSPAGDTISKYVQQTHSKLGRLSYVSASYDAQGNIVDGFKETHLYNEQGKPTSKKTENWNTDSWVVTSYTISSYNESGQLIEEESGSDIPTVKSEYLWENDTISTWIRSLWNNAEATWELSVKKEYTYKEDTTRVLSLFKDGDDWVEDQVWKHVYFTDVLGNEVEAVGRSDYGHPFYQHLDTLINQNVSYKDKTSKKYFWNGSEYILNSSSTTNYNDHCGVILEEIINMNIGSSFRYEYYFEHPYDPTLQTGNTTFHSDDMDISDGVEWHLYYYQKQSYHDTGETAIWKGIEGYYTDFDDGFKITNELNSDYKLAKYSYYTTNDDNPDDGIDWWLNDEHSYAYNDDNMMVEIVSRGRGSESEEMMFTSRQTWHYASGSFDEYCEITFTGDTVITDGNVEIIAAIADGKNYTWYDRNEDLLSETASLQIDSTGWYSVTAANDACINSDSVKISKVCDLTITGDSDLSGKTASFTADLDEEATPFYEWYDEQEVLLGTGATLEVDNPGVYTVKATGDYCMAEENWQVFLTTAVDAIAAFDEVKLYPNPTHDQIFIQFSKPAVTQMDLILYDVQGKIILHSAVNKGSKETMVNLNGIHSGLYFLKLKSPDNEFTKKFSVVSN